MGATDKKCGRAWRFRVLVVAALLLAVYVGTYLFLSRVTATTGTAVTDKGDRVVFVFGQNVIGENDVLYLSSADPVCYWVFWPLVFIDAATGTRYHTARVPITDGVGREVDFVGWSRERCKLYDVRWHRPGDTPKRESQDRG